MENLLLRLMCKNEIKKCNLMPEMFDDFEYIKQIEIEVIDKINEYNKTKDKMNYYFITDNPKNIGNGQSNFSFRIDENNKFVYNFPNNEYTLVCGMNNDEFRIYIIHWHTLGIYYIILVSTYNNIINKIKIDSNKSIEENLKLAFVLPIGTELPSENTPKQNIRRTESIWEYYQKRANELFGKPE